MNTPTPFAEPVYACKAHTPLAKLRWATQTGLATLGKSSTPAPRKAATAAVHSAMLSMF